MAPLMRTNKERYMSGTPHEMITGRTAVPHAYQDCVPPGGLGQRYSEMTGLAGPELRRERLGRHALGKRGVLNDAISTAGSEGHSAKSPAQSGKLAQ